MKNPQDYHGITYFKFLDNLWIQNLWRKYFCKRNIHLFDESISLESHSLSCDACDLNVDIEKIDTQYVVNYE